MAIFVVLHTTHNNVYALVSVQLIIYSWLKLFPDVVAMYTVVKTDKKFSTAPTI